MGVQQQSKVIDWWIFGEFCMLQLNASQALKLGPNVAKASLAAPEMVAKDKSFLVAGWGRILPKKTTRDLHTVMLPFYADCQQYFFNETAKTHFCLGYDNRLTKTAYGDQGGPVFSNSLRVVYGMIVNGRGETFPMEVENRPMLMAYIGPVRKWIERIHLIYGLRL